MSFFQTLGKSVAPPKPVSSPARPVAVNLVRKKVTDSQVLQELVDILQNTSSSTFKNREEYARTILREQG